MAERVRITTKILYLDSPRLVEARKRTWRECAELVEELLDLVDLPLDQMDARRRGQIARLEQKLRERTMPQAPYSSVARSCLKAHGLDYLLAAPEAARAA